VIAWVGAHHCPGEFGLAGADQAGDADDLARVDRQRDVTQYLPPAQSGHPQHRLTGALHRSPLRVELLQAAGEHEFNELPDRGVPRIDRRHPLAVPKDRHPVGQVEHLVELVADVDDPDAGPLEQPEPSGEFLRLPGRQGRRRLVHHQDAHLA
jgi:hypothetical protein